MTRGTPGYPSARNKDSGNERIRTRQKISENMNAQLQKAKKLEHFPRDNQKCANPDRVIYVYSPQPQLAAHMFCAECFGCPNLSIP